VGGRSDGNQAGSGHLFFYLLHRSGKGKIVHQWTNGNDGYPLKLPLFCDRACCVFLCCAVFFFLFFTFLFKLAFFVAWRWRVARL